jgi:hypothetical protein
MTGGYVHAGYHEVMYTEATRKTVDAVKKEAEESGDERILWRVSSTLFSHMRYNVDLTPLEELKHLYDEEYAKKKYIPMTAHECLLEELRAINLVPK